MSVVENGESSREQKHQAKYGKAGRAFVDGAVRCPTVSFEAKANRNFDTELAPPTFWHAHHWTCCCCRFHDRWSVRQLSPARRLSAAALGDEGPPYTEVQKLLTGLFERTGIVWWARDRIAGCVMDARFHLGVGVFNFLLSFLERVCCS